MCDVRLCIPLPQKHATQEISNPSTMHLLPGPMHRESNGPTTAKTQTPKISTNSLCLFPVFHFFVSNHFPMKSNLYVGSHTHFGLLRKHALRNFCVTQCAYIAWTPSMECHYPPDKCNAPRFQFFSGVCVSSTDSGTDTNCQLFRLGPTHRTRHRGLLWDAKSRRFFPGSC